MEVLSGAASGIAVVSLSIQLIECVGSIKTFIRNMKDAQKELERLVDLLERLEALLEDVRALMERQASLEHFPTPSATIFKSLKSCEKTLEPLQAIVDKYKSSKSKASTSMGRLKIGLGIGFKAKDIQDFEMRIEQEINFLHASLGANCGAILIQLGPVLLRQGNHETIQQSSAKLINPKVATVIDSFREGDAMLSNANIMRPSVSITLVDSPLKKLGVYQRKIVRRVPCISEKRATDCKEGDKTIVSETHETTLLWGILGYGLTWIQRRSFGRVVPSLSTFPVVESFSIEIWKVFEYEGTQDFQDMLRRGVIHPFSRDYTGWSLLHIAAMHGRADIYLLLQNLGLKPNASIYGETPLTTVLENEHIAEKRDLTTIYRYALEDTDMEGNSILYYTQRMSFFDCSIDSALWLYQQSKNILPYEDSRGILYDVIWYKWTYLCWQFEAANPMIEYPNFDVDAETLNFLKKIWDPFLLEMFNECSNSYDSFKLGGIFLEWMSGSDIDVEQFINQEVEIANASDPWSGLPRRFIFEPCDEGGWRLGFELAFDKEASGYPLVREFQAVSIGPWSSVWPMYEDPHPSKEYSEWKHLQEARFQRRMDAKARKRGGQKKRKSRMPGTWVH